MDLVFLLVICALLGLECLGRSLDRDLPSLSRKET